jgi:hypothetical protein
MARFSVETGAPRHALTGFRSRRPARTNYSNVMKLRKKSVPLTLHEPVFVD